MACQITSCAECDLCTGGIWSGGYTQVVMGSIVWLIRCLMGTTWMYIETPKLAFLL